ncbi:MAG: carboxypeptidase-like regulatory domain-containing protein [Acidobacteriota bacterium]
MNGKAALAFFGLASATGFEGEPQVLDPAGLTVHLVRMEDAEAHVEEAMPAGAWIVPTPGAYRFWIEGNGWISPAHGVMRYSAPPFKGRGSMVYRRVVRAGTVRLAKGETLGPTEELRLLHLDSHQSLGFPLPEMSRRVTSDAHEGVLMPAGPVLAGVFDTVRDEYRWLARPVAVPAQGVVEIAPPTPSGDTSVLVILDRPRAIQEWTEDDVELRLKNEQGKDQSPDVWIATAERVYGVFFDRPERLASIAVTSSSAGLPVQDLALRAGKVETYRGVLRPLPGLKVSLLMPPEFTLPEGAAIQLLTHPERDLVTARPLAQELSSAFEHVPARNLAVVVEIPPSRVTQQVNLEDWRDREIEIRIREFRIHGVVYRGEEPARAKIDFQLYGSDPKYRKSVTTDAQGRYEITIHRPPSQAKVVLVDDEPLRKPHWEILGYTSFEEDTEFDFHVPENRVEVAVTADPSGEPVEGAKVRYANLHLADDEPIGEYFGWVETDADGFALLPALRNGSLDLHASAEGFLSAELSDFVVDDQTGERTLEIALETEGEATPLILAFTGPGGSPAVGAEVVVLRGADGTFEWSGTTGVAGELEIPERFISHPFAARFAGAGFLLDRIPSGDERFAFPAAGPTLQALLVSRGEPIPWARIALDVRGMVLHGPILQWLVGESAADGNGTWRGSGIPAGSFTITAWKAGEDALRDPNALAASFGQVVPPPWPSRLEVEAVD